jgi:hypothetical protein
MMKLFGIIFLSLLIARSVIETGRADETAGEKIETSANNVKRTVKRAAHKAEESLCKKDSADCLGKQIKNRATELKDATVDGVKDLKNKAD